MNLIVASLVLRLHRFDARGGFRVEIPVAMPRDMATTTREYAQLEESFAHERKCVSPASPGPSPRAKCVVEDPPH